MKEPDDSDARSAMATLAVDLDAARGHLERIRDEAGPQDWPVEMSEGDVAPSLPYQIVLNVSILLEEYLLPAIALARRTAALTPESVERHWEAERTRALAVDLHDALRRMYEDAESLAGVLEEVQRKVPDLDLSPIRRTAAELARQAAQWKPVGRALANDNEDGGGNGERAPSS